MNVDAPKSGQGWGACVKMALGVGLVALSLRLLCLYQLHGSPIGDLLMGDGKVYDQWAARIAAGDWVGDEVFYQAPLYPYFLGVLFKVVGHDLTAVKIVQAVLGSFSCVLLAQAAWRLFTSRKAAWIAGVLLAACPSAIFWDLCIQKSVLDTFFVCATLAIVGAMVHRFGQRDSNPSDAATTRITTTWGDKMLWTLLGVVMGLLMLTRENALVLVAVVVVWLAAGAWSRHRGFGAWALGGFLLGMVLILSPVVIRNYVVGHEIHLSTSQMGPNFYIGNHPDADGTYVPLVPGRGNAMYERIDAKRLAEAAERRTLSPGEVSGFWMNQAFEFIQSKPGEWMRLMERKALLLVNRTEVIDTEDQYTAADYSSVLKVGDWVLNFGMLFPFAVAGVVLTWPWRRRLWVVYAMTLAYGASVVGFYVVARYRLPLIPFLVLLAAGGFGVAVDTWLGRRGEPTPMYEELEGAMSRRVIAVVLLMTALWICRIKLVDESGMRAVSLANIGSTLWTDEHNNTESLTFLKQATELSPRYAQAHSKYAAVLDQTGDLQTALAEHATAISLSPGDPMIHYNAAVTLRKAGKPDAAIEQLDAAIHIDSSDPRFYNDKGLNLMALRRIGEALVAYSFAIHADPNFAPAWNNLGSALARTGQISEAANAFGKAVALDPSDADALYNLANAELHLNKFADAAARFHAYLQLRPDDAEAQEKLKQAVGALGAASAQTQPGK